MRWPEKLKPAPLLGVERCTFDQVIPRCLQLLRVPLDVFPVVLSEKTLLSLYADRSVDMPRYPDWVRPGSPQIWVICTTSTDSFMSFGRSPVQVWRKDCPFTYHPAGYVLAAPALL